MPYALRSFVCVCVCGGGGGGGGGGCVGIPERRANPFPYRAHCYIQFLGTFAKIVKCDD